MDGRQLLVLTQEAVEAKSNEIFAVRQPLERLELTGALVTMDPIGTQTDTAVRGIEPRPYPGRQIFAGLGSGHNFASNMRLNFIRPFQFYKGGPYERANLPKG